MVRPTVRNMPPFMFQVQDTIKNKNHLFYQMDRGTKVRGIKRDFELFLGLIDFDIYNKINEKNAIIKELKKLENHKSLYEDEIKREYSNLKSSYHRIFTHLNKNIDIESLDNDYFMNLQNLNNLELKYKLDTNIGKDIESLQIKENKQSIVVENLKIEFSNIQNQMQHIDTANLKLNTSSDIIYLKTCPTCDKSMEDEIKVFKKAKQKILDEKNFLNHTFNTDILREKELEVKEKLDVEKAILKNLIKEKKKLIDDNKELQTIQQKENLLNEIKGIIKKNIETIDNYTKRLFDAQRKEKLEERLERLEKELKKVDLKKKIQEAELAIGQYATKMLETLPFDENDYGKANLKFDIKDVTAYQQDTNNLYYLDEIGSAENYLSFHLSIFLGLHKYILEHNSSILPSFIFLDQPSQVYFPKEEDFKNGTGDIKKVEDMYKSIIKFIEDTNNSSIFSKIQIIIVDHFHNKEDWYQKYLVEPIWEKNKNLGLIKD